ncbi:hypothetical protein HDR60_00370 [bacterium]|nr:hypothetical protein [bacterium]
MNKKYIKIALFTLIILFIIFISILPITKSHTLKKEIIKIKENQIKLIKNNLNLIPQLVNISKGYLINDKEALKNIIKINLIAKEQPKNFNEIYDNQTTLLSLTMSLLKDSKKHSPLTTNQEFIKINNELETLNLKIENYKKICIEKSNKLIKLSTLPIYNKIINIKDINNIICSEKFSEYKTNFNF